MVLVTKYQMCYLGFFFFSLPRNPTVDGLNHYTAHEIHQRHQTCHNFTINGQTTQIISCSVNILAHILITNTQLTSNLSTPGQYLQKSNKKCTAWDVDGFVIKTRNIVIFQWCQGHMVNLSLTWCSLEVGSVGRWLADQQTVHPDRASQSVCHLGDAHTQGSPHRTSCRLPGEDPYGHRRNMSSCPPSSHTPPHTHAAHTRPHLDQQKFKVHSKCYNHHLNEFSEIFVFLIY